MHDRLDVVNSCIATMGEASINTLEEYHPYRDTALNYLQQANRSAQKRGWWFNEEQLVLVPDVSGYLYVPQDALGVRILDCDTAAQRGKRLYNTRRNNYEWDRDVTVSVVRLIEFEQLPFVVADYVAAHTVLRFQREFDGDRQRTSELALEVQAARLDLVAEDTRQRRPNLLLTPSNLANISLISGQRINRIPYTPGWPR